MGEKKVSRGDSDTDIWCCCCGDRTFFANIEEREIAWYKKDLKRGIGICVPCSLEVNERYLVLPPPEEDE